MSDRYLPGEEPGGKIVRLATHEDAEEILKICTRLHEENGKLPICERKVRETIEETIYGKVGVIGVIGEPGAIEGCIFLRIGQLWYSNAWVLEEYFSFVLPEHRRSRNALELVEFAKRCALNMGLPLLIGILSSERTEAKVRLYERKLSKRAGAFFVFNEEALREHLAAAE